MMKERLGNDKKMEMVPDNRPYFFKIMFDGLTTEKLRIPPAFMKHISKDFSDRATLKGPSGSCWNVKLSSSLSGTYLQDGWQEFQRDHSLGDNEFLLFRYDGNMCFSVQIFDKSGCERGDVSVSGKHQEFALSNGKRKRGRPRKYPLPLKKRGRGRPRKYPLSSNSCEVGPGQHFPQQESSQPKEVREEKDAQKKIKAEETDLPKHQESSQPKEVREEKDTQKKIKAEETDLPKQEMDSQFTKVKEEKGTQRKIKTKEPDLPNLEMDSDAGRCIPGMQSPTEEERTRAWNEAESFTSNHPYFISFLTKACVHKVFIMTVPMPFSRAHLPLAKIKMVLRDPKGKAWVINCIPAGGKHYLCGGWAAFARGNNLKKDDVCVFELVDENEMQVHIFRI